MTSASQPPLRPSRAAMLTIGAIVLALVLVGLVVHASAGPALPPGQRMFRRVPSPPRDARSLLGALGVGSLTWNVSVLAILPLWWLAYRVPLTHQRAWRSLAAQLTALLGLVLVTAPLRYAIEYHGAPSAPSFSAYLPVALIAGALPMLAIAALVNVLETRRRAVRGALEAQRLRAELAESRLVAVTSQLQPHFLFNTLQSISTLI